MARYIFQGTFKDLSGNAVGDGSIVVKNANTTALSTIYGSSGASTAITTATVSSSDNGFFGFWVDDADYVTSQKFKIELSKVNFKTKTYDDLVIFPPVSLDGTETLSNKTFEDTLTCSSKLSVAGTITGSSDLNLTGNFASSGLTTNHIYGSVGSSSGTFSKPILTSPFIANQTNANHSHLSTSGGGTLSGFAIQTVSATGSSDLTGSNNIVVDDTKPQVGEMNAFADCNVSITPTSATNDLLINATAVLSSTGAGVNVAIAVFKDADSTSISVVDHRAETANARYNLKLSHEISAGSTTAQTFKLYFAASGGDCTINGAKVAGRYYGGVYSTTLSVTEIQS